LLKPSSKIAFLFTKAPPFIVSKFCSVTKSKEQIPSWESNRCSSHFMGPKGSLPHSQDTVTCPYSETDGFVIQHSINHVLTLRKKRFPSLKVLRNTHIYYSKYDRLICESIFKLSDFKSNTECKAAMKWFPSLWLLIN
jgi:hypothetical protein